MNVYLLHYRCAPQRPTPDIRGGYADVCAICGSTAEADDRGRALIRAHGFEPQELLAARACVHPQPGDLDELEATLLAKALQREPQAALQMTVWGDGTQEPRIEQLRIPGQTPLQ